MIPKGKGILTDHFLYDDEYDESCIAGAERDVGEIRDAALKKVRETHPEIEYVIDRRSIDDYALLSWEYPGKWYYMGLKLPDGCKSKNELIDEIAAETIRYFCGG